MKLNIANKLTLARIVLSTVLCVFHHLSCIYI